MKQFLGDEVTDLHLTREETQLVLRRQLAGSVAVAVAIVVFAALLAAL
jgi:hypothetical protein